MTKEMTVNFKEIARSAGLRERACRIDPILPCGLFGPEGWHPNCIKCWTLGHYKYVCPNSELGEDGFICTMNLSHIEIDAWLVTYQVDATPQQQLYNIKLLTEGNFE